MYPVPRTTIDITYDNLNILHLMPGCSTLKLGWNYTDHFVNGTVTYKTYLITSTSDFKIRCQMWLLQNARQTIINACQLTIKDI